MRKNIMKVRLVILLLPLAAWLVSERPQSEARAADVGPSASIKSLEKPDPATQVRLSEAYGRLPLSFEANHGQMSSDVKFFSRGSGYGIFITPTEAVLRLASGLVEKPTGSKIVGRSAALRTPSAASSSQRTDILRMKLVGANRKPQVTGLDELPGKANYFIGNDPKKWRRKIVNYAKVKYQDVYPGIDLVHYGNQRQLEYDFLVRPGADPRTLRLRFEGAKKMEIDARGDLVLRTGGGEVRQHKPVVYQEVDGVRKDIQGGYVLQENKAVTFDIGAYDHSKSLIIDPVLSYSTYLGGSGGFGGGIFPPNESGLAIAVDAGGNAYVTGYTFSTNFPTVNPIQGPSDDIRISAVDVFVSKLNPAGNALVYSTYLGGFGNDTGNGIAVDSAGNAYITGFASSDFPTVNPLPGAPVSGAFVTKLNDSGSALVYSTHVWGGSGRGIALDSAGRAWVTGSVSTPDIPTVNPFQASLAGDVDAFVAKLNAAGSELLYWSYLGGSNFDEGTGITVSPVGNVYVTGSTSSLNFPTISPLQATFGGLQDAFVVQLDSAGFPDYSTYLGGEGLDRGRGIAVDSAGNAYVTGATGSPDFPTTVNVFEPDRVVGLFKTTSAGEYWFAIDRGLGTRSIKALALNPALPSTIFAGAFDGVYKSTDSGATWTASNNGLGNQDVIALAADPKNGARTFAGTNGAGVYRSADGGASWVAINAGLPSQSRVQAIAIDPQNRLTLYAGIFGAGVFKSLNGGETWTESSAGLFDSFGGSNVSVLAIDPKKPSTLYAGTESGIFKTTNGGASWAASSTGLIGAVNALLIDPRSPSTLYAGTGDGLFKSTNGGAGWSRISVPQLPGVRVLAADPDHPATIYAGGLSRRIPGEPSVGIFKSEDGGGSWTPMIIGLIRSSQVAALAVDPADPANIYAGIVGTAGGGFVSKLNPGGSQLDYSTHFGAEGSGIGVDSAGNAYITGFADFHLLEMDPLPFTGPGPGAFIAKLDATGSTLIYSSFIGGFGSVTWPDAAARVDAGNSVAVDPDGNAYVTGAVEILNFPILNPLPYIVTSGTAFVTKISNFTPAPASKQKEPFRWTVTASPAEVIATGQSEVTGAITLTALGAGSGTKSAKGVTGKIELSFKNPALQIDNGVYSGMRLLFTPGFAGAFTATRQSGRVGIVAVENRTANGQCYGVITINMAAGATVRDGDFIRIEGVRARIDGSAAAQPGTDIYVDIQPLNGQAVNAFTPNRIKVARSFEGLNMSPITVNGDTGIRVGESFAKAFMDLDANDDGINLNDRLDTGGGNLLTTVGNKPVASFPQALGLPNSPTRIFVLIEDIPPGVSHVSFPQIISASPQTGAVLALVFSSDQNPPDVTGAIAVYEFRTTNQSGASDLLPESFDIIPVYTLSAGGTATGYGSVFASLVGSSSTAGCAAPNPGLLRPRYTTLLLGSNP